MDRCSRVEWIDQERGKRAKLQAPCGHVVWGTTDTRVHFDNVPDILGILAPNVLWHPSCVCPSTDMIALQHLAPGKNHSAHRRQIDQHAAGNTQKNNVICITHVRLMIYYICSFP